MARIDARFFLVNWNEVDTQFKNKQITDFLDSSGEVLSGNGEFIVEVESYLSNWKISHEASEIYDGIHSLLDPSIKQDFDKVFGLTFWDCGDENYLDQFSDITDNILNSVDYGGIILSPMIIECILKVMNENNLSILYNIYPTKSQDTYLPYPESFSFYLNSWKELCFKCKNLEGEWGIVGWHE
jgi:hypothetical protein